ncbi:cupin domain-containing protein [Streptomyces sp. NPDC101118]|uniref:cupin domain-containing protein n=1 Tax=Streptomyces sp. NPDC101118 TaxID=3366109 RepID=UPI003827A384
MTQITGTRRDGVIHVPAGTGPSLWIPEDTQSEDALGSVKATYTVKVDSATTGGTLSAVEASVPPGSGPPPHAHDHADEAYYILEGTFEVLDGDRLITARPGDFIFIPRGTTHRFKNVGADAARMLFLFTPAGFEGLFYEIGERAVPGQPWPRVTEKDIERAGEAGPRYFP